MVDGDIKVKTAIKGSAPKWKRGYDVHGNAHVHEAVKHAEIVNIGHKLSRAVAKASEAKPCEFLGVSWNALFDL
ncbi:MAG: hypothetical protein JWL59_4869 [Chthoniobacteraceae bacterium]|nr:hypothetical protein [Chthoniobacteraceae bacterium]